MHITAALKPDGNEKSKELEELLSLEHQVGKQVPPVFIWHTLTDQSRSQSRIH